MRLRLSVLLALLSLAETGPARGAPIKSPADVLPASTLAYADIRQPGAFAREVGALFRGSVLGNMPDSLGALRPRAGAAARGPSPELAVFGEFLSPELVREAGRIKGAAVALTGFGKGMPEFVVIVLPGESNAPGFAMRMLLASYGHGYARFDRKAGTQIYESTRFEPVATVEGVRLYQEVRRLTTTLVVPPGDKPPEGKTEVRKSGPVLAMMPDALLLGSPDAVKDVIRRLKGKGEGDTLAGVKTFREASDAIGKGPGLFAYVNPVATLDALAKAGLGKGDRDALDLVKKLVNPKALRAASASLILDKGTLHYRELYLLDPDEKSPLLAVFPSAALKADLLHFAPRDALLFAALSNNDGAKRWKRLLALADEVSQVANPSGTLPSKHVEALEGALKIDIGKDVAGRIKAVAFALAGPKRLRAAKGTPPAVLIVRATGEKAAQTLVGEVLPKVMAVALRDPDLKPTDKEVDGQRVWTLKSGGGWVHYGRRGDTVILGATPELTAEALNNGAKETGLSADEKVAAGVKRLDGPILLGVVKPISLIAVFMLVGSKAGPAPDAGPSSAPTRPPDAKPVRRLRRAAAAEPPKLPPRKGPAGVDKLLELLAKEEPLILGITRKPDRIQVDVRYTGLRRMVPRLIDLVILERAAARPPAPKPRPGRFEPKPIDSAKPPARDK